MENLTIDERDALARGYFRDGYNCCQSVLLAFKDVIGLPQETIASLSAGFGGGMGRLREVCGAMSAAVFMAGVITPSSDPSNHAERTANYALVQQFAASFKEAQGSIICRELLGIRASHKDSAEPSHRDTQYYTTRPCERIVGESARMIARQISAQTSSEPR